MIYEFVEFYPYQEGEAKSRSLIGTCHIYLIDLSLDIRGIKVIKHKNGLIFRFPTGFQIDPELKKRVPYPLLNFTCDEKKKELWSFMFDEVAPIIKKRLYPNWKPKPKEDADTNDCKASKIA